MVPKMIHAVNIELMSLTHRRPRHRVHRRYSCVGPCNSISESFATLHQGCSQAVETERAQLEAKRGVLRLTASSESSEEAANSRTHYANGKEKSESRVRIEGGKGAEKGQQKKV